MQFNKSQIETFLTDIQQQEGDSFSCNSQVILNEAETHAGIYSSIAIKVLSIFGGFFASSTFIAFLFSARIIDFDNRSSAIVLGLLFIGAALAGTFKSKSVFFDTVLICIYSTGFCLLFMGLYDSMNLALLMGVCIACITFYISKSFILSFASVVVTNGFFIWMFIENRLYAFLILPFLFMCVSLMLLHFYEAKIITRPELNKKYKPLQLGFFISYAILLYLRLHVFFAYYEADAGSFSYYFNYNYLILSIAHISGIIFITNKILRQYHSTQLKQQWPAYLLIVLLLIPTLYAPFISGALLLIIMAFYFNYKFEFAVSIALFIYVITRYYYDLSFTLLEKSGILFFTGLIFIGLWWYFINKVKQHESI